MKTGEGGREQAREVQSSPEQLASVHVCGAQLAWKTKKHVQSFGILRKKNDRASTMMFSLMSSVLFIKANP